MIDLTTLNFWAILVTVVVSFAIGGLWYSPLMFANAWMAEHGYKEEDLGSAAKAMSITALAGSVFFDCHRDWCHCCCAGRVNSTPGH